MASSEVQVLGSTASASLAAGRVRRKPRDSAAGASPSARQQSTRMPLSIPVGRRSASQGPSGAAGTSTAQQQQQQQQPSQRQANAAQQRQQRQAQPGDSDVIVLDSDSDSDDDDVVITGVKPAPPRKRPRLSPHQLQAGAAAAAAGVQQPAGQRVERGLLGGYFVMPTWGTQQQQQQQQAAPAPPPREASPEPAFKCLICLDGIKPDNMGITPCGHMFCYSCIVEAVKATKKCPKCRKGLTLKGLKRIYPN